MHPIFGLIKAAEGLGHTTLTRDVGVGLMRQGRIRYDVETLTPLYQNGELVKINGCVSTSIGAEREALVARRLLSGGGRLSVLQRRLRSAHSHRSGPANLTFSQATAFRSLCTLPYGVLAGAPGTGKTYLTAKLVDFLLQEGLSVQVAAPTGKAAEVLSRKVPCLVSTIHSMLALIPGQTPGYNATNPLCSDVVIIDESSMVDAEMFYYLIDALPETTGLILVGDPYQLPPVGAGAPFHTIIQHNAMPVYTLTEVQRQSSDSGIIKVAHDMISGRPLSYNEDVGFLPPPAQWRDFAASFWLDRYADNPDSGRVIAPFRNRKFESSIIQINKKISQTHGKDTSSVPTPNGIKVGDIVIFKRNDRKLGIINGQEGVVTMAHNMAVDVLVGRKVKQVNVADVEQAYAVTVHKAQGSEWEEVCILLPEESRSFLDYRMVYTALTRARKKAWFVGDPNAMLRGKSFDLNRHSLFKWFLVDPSLMDQLQTRQQRMGYKSWT